MGSAQLREIVTRLREAELAIYGTANFGGVSILLAIVFPPADRAQTYSAGRLQRLVSAAGAAESDRNSLHKRIDGAGT